ncbi:MAG: type II toxin-antitoxin system death-on-curing family toxin [Anaerolineae bacterium]|nr:type II toxin-antitoxin system death-on-curing family toxin [Anaerolineae bacterium]NUQ04983.1 type II toxin-antitoxin system death-on-curing family toxin [Anaerolineae bacterium]
MPSNDSKPIHALSASDLYNLNDAVTEGHTFVRDLHLLNSAARRPNQVVFGEVQYPTLVEKAAVLLHSLAYHHLFADGNKRTAALGAALFLERNDHRLTWDEATARAFILEIAQGELDVPQIAERLARWIAPREEES